MNPTLLHIIERVLFVIGAVGFVMHLVAQWRFARILRTRYPDKWDIIAQAENGPAARLLVWARLQRVLRTNIAELFDDAELLRWHRIWRFAPWLAWPCLIGALLIQATTGVH